MLTTIYKNVFFNGLNYHTLRLSEKPLILKINTVINSVF